MSQQQAKAVENTLSGERSYATISYPLTGDLENDMVSAVTTIVRSMGATTFESSIQIAGRVLEYLSKRFKAEADAIPKAIGYPYPNEMHTSGGSIGEPCAPSIYQQANQLQNQYWRQYLADHQFNSACNGLHDAESQNP